MSPPFPLPGTCVGPRPSGRTCHGAVVVAPSANAASTMWVVGGFDKVALADVHSYAVDSQTWTAHEFGDDANVPSARHSHVGCLSVCRSVVIFCVCL